MRGMRLIVVATVALAFTACAGVRSDMRSSAYGSVATQFVSSPPGARIEIDGNYVGNAPMTYTWPRSYQDGPRFRNEVTVKAFPADGGRSQKKFYESRHMELPMIPQRVYFDMNTRPETEE